MQAKRLWGCPEIRLSDPTMGKGLHSQGTAPWAALPKTTCCLVVAPAHAAEPVVSFSGKRIFFPLVKYFAYLKVSTWHFQIKALRALFTVPPWSEQEGCPFPRRCCFLVAKMCCPPSAKHQHIFTGRMPAGNPDKKRLFSKHFSNSCKFFLNAGC